MGGGPKPNSNVPIVDVPKWLGRGGVRPNWDNVLKYVFFFLKASLNLLSSGSIRSFEILMRLAQRN